jgi:acyl transferase domain-containing protein
VNESDIAIVGIACRFPKANTVNELWSNLINGVDCVSRFNYDQLISSGIAKSECNKPNYVPARGVLSDIEYFDNNFFNMTPREAELTDPQQRFFMECVHECIKDIYSDNTTNEIGLFAGASLSTYMLGLINSVSCGDVDPYLLLFGNDKDYLCSRTSYQLNLKGPSVSVQTACSTSLVATHLAIQSLLLGECEIAIAGGVNIKTPQEAGYLYSPGMIYSSDAKCKPFDIQSDGTVSGNGVGLVALKRLVDAIEGNDQIYAVIKGSAINNDGNEKVGFTAPSPIGQKRVIEDALFISGIDPKSV